MYAMYLHFHPFFKFKMTFLAVLTVLQQTDEIVSQAVNYNSRQTLMNFIFDEQQKPTLLDLARSTPSSLKLALQ